MAHKREGRPSDPEALRKAWRRLLCAILGHNWRAEWPGDGFFCCRCKRTLDEVVGELLRRIRDRNLTKIKKEGEKTP